MIYYLPLEHLDQRYTIELDRLLCKEFGKRKINFTKVDGVSLVSEIKTGAFLDADSTNYFKFAQLQKISKYFKDGLVKNGDLFFVSDIWFPGIEAIKYMAMFHHLKVTVGGISHAGSWTETDFVRELESWAKDVEVGWFKMYDFICCGSIFAKADLEKKRATYFRRINVTGIPYDFEWVRKFASKEKENTVVLTGRLDDEKQPWNFDNLAEQFPSIQFVKTIELNLKKADYYRLLGRSKVVFSSALQENFGFGVIEAVTLGCMPVVPDRLAYKEFYPKRFRYDNLNGAKRMISDFLENHRDVSFLVEKHQYNVEKVVDVIERHL